MMNRTTEFHLRRSTEPRTGFGDYEYDILRGDVVVARYGHDYRGGEHWIRLGAGPKEGCALGPVWTFAERGGAEPLALTAAAMDWLRLRAPATGA